MLRGDHARDRRGAGARHRVCAATPRSASRTGPRPTCASGCSRTSSGCTSRSTTRRRPVSSWRARTPTSSRSTRSSILIPLTIASSLILVARHRRHGDRRASVLALLALGALPLLNVVGDALQRTASRRSRLGLQQELGDLSGVVEESVAGVRVVKGFGAERLQVEPPRRRGRRGARPLARRRRACAPASSRSSTSCRRSSLVAILWYGGHLVLDGELELGDIVAFNSYILMLIWPLRMAGMLVAQASRVVGGRRAAPRDPRHRARDRRPPRRRRSCPPGPGELRFEGVSTSRYGAGPPGARRPRPRDPRRRGGRARRPDRSGKTHGGAPGPALLRRRRRARVLLDGVDVRDVQLARPAPRGRHRVRGHVPVLRHRAREHRLRRSRGVDGRGARAPRGSPAPTTFIDDAARRLRHRDRRARLLALGRPAPADRDRPRRPRRPAGADPRRRDLVGRPDEGARDPRRAARGDGTAGPR